MRYDLLDLPSQIDDSVGVMKDLEGVLQDLVSFRLSAFPAVEEPLVKLPLQPLELLPLRELLQLIFSVDPEVLCSIFAAAAEEVEDRLGARQQIEGRRNQHRSVAIAKSEYSQVELPF